MVLPIRTDTRRRSSTTRDVLLAMEMKPGPAYVGAIAPGRKILGAVKQDIYIYCSRITS